MSSPAEDFLKTLHGGKDSGGDDDAHAPGETRHNLLSDVKPKTLGATEKPKVTAESLLAVEKPATPAAPASKTVAEPEKQPDKPPAKPATSTDAMLLASLNTGSGRSLMSATSENLAEKAAKEQQSVVSRFGGGFVDNLVGQGKGLMEIWSGKTDTASELRKARTGKPTGTDNAAVNILNTASDVGGVLGNLTLDGTDALAGTVGINSNLGDGKTSKALGTALTRAVDDFKTGSLGDKAEALGNVTAFGTTLMIGGGSTYKGARGLADDASNLRILTKGYQEASVASEALTGIRSARTATSMLSLTDDTARVGTSLATRVSNLAGKARGGLTSLTDEVGGLSTRITRLTTASADEGLNLAGRIAMTGDEAATLGTRVLRNAGDDLVRNTTTLTGSRATTLLGATDETANASSMLTRRLVGLGNDGASTAGSFTRVRPTSLLDDVKPAGLLDDLKPGRFIDDLKPASGLDDLGAVGRSGLRNRLLETGPRMLDDLTPGTSRITGLGDDLSKGAPKLLDDAAGRGTTVLDDAAKTAPAVVDNAAARGTTVLDDAAKTAPTVIDDAAGRGTTVLDDAAKTAPAVVDDAAARGTTVLDDAGKTAPKVVDDAAGRGTTVLEDAGKTAPKVVDDAAGRGTTVLDDAAKTAPAVVDNAAARGTTVLDDAAKTAPAVIDDAAGRGTTVLDDAAKTAPAVVDDAAARGTTVLDDAAKTAPAVVDNAAARGTTVLDDAAKTAPTVVDDAAGRGTTVLDDAGKTAPKVVDDAAGRGTTVLDDAGKTAPKVVDDAAGRGTTVLDDAGKTAPAVVDDAAARGTTVLDDAAKTAPAVVDDAAGRGTTVLDDAANTAPAVVDDAAARGTTVLDDAGKTAPKVVDDAAGRGTTVLDDATKTAPRVVDDAAARGTTVLDDAGKTAPTVVDDAAGRGTTVLDDAAKTAPRVVDDAAARGTTVLDDAGKTAPKVVDDAAARGTTVLDDAAKTAPRVVDDAAARGTTVLDDAAKTAPRVVDDAAARGTTVLDDAAKTAPRVVDDAAGRGTTVLDDAAKTAPTVVDDAAARGTTVLDDAARPAATTPRIPRTADDLQRLTAETSEALTTQGTRLSDDASRLAGTAGNRAIADKLDEISTLSKNLGRTSDDLKAVQQIKNHIDDIARQGGDDIANQLRVGVERIEQNAIKADRLREMQRLSTVLDDSASTVSRTARGLSETIPGTSRQARTIRQQLDSIARQADDLGRSTNPSETLSKMKTTLQSLRVSKGGQFVDDLEKSINALDDAAVKSSTLRMIEGQGARARTITDEIGATAGQLQDDLARTTGRIPRGANPEAITSKLDDIKTGVARLGDDLEKGGRKLSDSADDLARLRTTVDELPKTLGPSSLDRVRKGLDELDDVIKVKKLEQTTAQTQGLANVLSGRVGEIGARVADGTPEAAALQSIRTATTSLIGGADSPAALATIRDQIALLRTTTNGAQYADELTGLFSKLEASSMQQKAIADGLIDASTSTLKTKLDTIIDTGNLAARTDDIRELGQRIPFLRYLTRSDEQMSAFATSAQNHISRLEIAANAAARPEIARGSRSTLLRLAEGGDEVASGRLAVEGLRSEGRRMRGLVGGVEGGSTTSQLVRMFGTHGVVKGLLREPELLKSMAINSALLTGGVTLMSSSLYYNAFRPIILERAENGEASEKVEGRAPETESNRPVEADRLEEGKPANDNNGARATEKVEEPVKIRPEPNRTADLEFTRAVGEIARVAQLNDIARVGSIVVRNSISPDDPEADKWLDWLTQTGRKYGWGRGVAVSVGDTAQAPAVNVARSLKIRTTTGVSDQPTRPKTASTNFDFATAIGLRNQLRLMTGAGASDARRVDGISGRSQGSTASKLPSNLTSLVAYNAFRAEGMSAGSSSLSGVENNEAAGLDQSGGSVPGGQAPQPTTIATNLTGQTTGQQTVTMQAAEDTDVAAV